MAENMTHHKELFEGISDPESLFTDTEKCLGYLAERKWHEGYICRKCGHTNYCSGSKPYSRRCTKCKSEESATAHTLFHRCRIPLNEAFRIAWMVCKNPDIPCSKISRTLDRRKMTCWKFKKKVIECREKHGKIVITE